MATKLGQQGYRRFDPSGGGSRAQGASLGSPKVAWLRGPWPGYVPSMDHSQVPPGTALLCRDIIEHEGVLSQQNGFEKVGKATLPLGGTTPPDVGSEEPVVGIFMGRTNATQAIRRYALTSDSSANGRGHMYELVSGAWQHVEFDANGTGLNAFTGDSGDPASTLVDAAHFPQGNYTLFASGQGNPIYRFPGAGTATKYEPITGLGSLSTLTANSLCIAEERIHAFGVTEGGTFYPSRWRWTSKGANAQFDPAQTGASFADLNEFGSEGLAVRQLGPRIALYLTNGVMLASRTGNTADPFRKDYSTLDRGLLSTHSIVDLGFGVHFGLFTDGWFLFRYDGVWEEKGITDKGYHKWLREFYGTLDWANRKRVICEYDEGERLVYIAFPQAGASGGAPSAVWIYDLQSDSVWPAEWGSKLPTCFGKFIEEVVAGPSWGDMTRSDPPGSWASYETQIGRNRIQHGTSNGYIYTHRPDLLTRDGELPTYLYQSHYIVGERADQFKSVSRIYVNYTRVEGNNNTNPTPIYVSYENENGTSYTGSIKQLEGAPNTVQVDFVSGMVRGTALKFSVSGTAPVKINGIGLSLLEEQSETRKET